MKTVLIDLWGTILANPEITPTEEIISKLNLNITHHQLIQTCDEQGLFSKTISSLTIWESVMNKFGKNKEDAIIANDIWLESARSVRLFPGTIEFLTALKDKGLILVLASAIGKDSFELLEESFSFKKYFDHIKPTYTVGFPKSEPYYERICKDLDLNPTETTMVGDNIWYDILPANKIGLNTILLSRLNIPPEDSKLIPVKTNICKSFDEVINNI